jgi:transposase InsO family protein
MRIFNKFRGTKGFVSIWERMIRFRYMITEQAKERCRVLAFWEKHGTSATTEAFRVSKRTLFRWQKKLKQSLGKLEGLNRGNQAPSRRRKRLVPTSVSKQIISLRTAHPRIGKEKVHALLLQTGYVGSVSTVGRIITSLKQGGRLPDPKQYSVSGKTGRMIERKRENRRRKLRRPKGYRVLEVDTVIRFVDGVKRYILTGVDTERRTAFAACYTNHGSRSAADFLNKCRQVLPDCPKAVQTDNGSEFALHFETACHNQKLTHFHTYPRSPKMNAHVERFNRTLDEEFLKFNRALMRDDVKAFNDKLVEWLLWYNGERPHFALGQVSPFRFMMRGLTAEECHMWWTYTPTCNKLFFPV